MRAIVNISSGRISGIAGWRARAIELDGKKEALLDEILKASVIHDGGSLSNLVIKKNRLINDWIFYVDGVRLPADSSTKIIVRDNTQIHIMDNPHKDISINELDTP